MKVKYVIKLSIITVTFLCLSIIAQAQPGGGGGDPDPNNNGGHGAPLDLGVSALIAAGIGYAVKKKYDARKREKVTEDGEK